MKKIIFAIGLIFALALLLGYSGVLSSLLVFLIVGAVPGTPLSLSPNFMFLVIGAILWAVLANLIIVRRVRLNKK